MALNRETNHLLSCQNCVQGRSTATCDLVDNLQSVDDNDHVVCKNCGTLGYVCNPSSQMILHFFNMKDLCRDILPQKNGLDMELWKRILRIAPRSSELVDTVNAYVKVHNIRQLDFFPTEAFRENIRDALHKLVICKPTLGDRFDVSAVVVATLIGGPLILTNAKLEEDDNKFKKKINQAPWVFFKLWEKINEPINLLLGNKNTMLSGVREFLFDTNGPSNNSTRLHLTDSEIGSLQQVDTLFKVFDKVLINFKPTVIRELKVFVKMLYQTYILVEATKNDNTTSTAGTPNDHNMRALFTCFSHCVLSKDFFIDLNVRSENQQESNVCWDAVVCHWLWMLTRTGHIPVTWKPRQVAKRYCDLFHKRGRAGNLWQDKDWRQAMEVPFRDLGLQTFNGSFPDWRV